MLRITEINRTESSTTLKLEGIVKEELIDEVRIACEEFLLSERQLSLDMGDVSFVERRAISLFRQLQRQQVNLINCSLFLSEQLKKKGS